MSGKLTHTDTVIVGAGPAGLGVAGMLAKRGCESVVLERGARAGDAWAQRYDALRLNSVGSWSRLPGLRLPRSYGTFPTRDQWVAYLDQYVRHFSLDVRCGVEAKRVERDAAGWRVETSGASYVAENVVVATGLDNEPWMPDWPGREGFEGRIVHASEFRTPEPFAGADVLVVGCGNTGSELAHLLAHGGASRVRIAVRTPPNMMVRQWRGHTPYYGSLLLDLLPDRAADALGRLGQRQMIGDLSDYGLPLPPVGIKTNLRRGIAPTVVDGFVESVKSGAVQVVAAVDAFDGRDVLLTSGERIAPDVVIAATGYRRALETLVDGLVPVGPLGAPVVTRDYEGEGAPGLYFAGYWSGLSGPLRAMRRQAKRIGRAIAARSARASASAGAPRRGRAPVTPAPPLTERVR